MTSEWDNTPWGGTAVAAKAETGPKFKTYEEYKERRRAGIRQLATELGMDS